MMYIIFSSSQRQLKLSFSCSTTVSETHSHGTSPSPIYPYNCTLTLIGDTYWSIPIAQTYHQTERKVIQTQILQIPAKKLPWSSCVPRQPSMLSNVGPEYGCELIIFLQQNISIPIETNGIFHHKYDILLLKETSWD